MGLTAGADHRSQQRGVCRAGDVVDIYAVEISLEEVVALEGEVRVRECKLRDRELDRLGKLRDVTDAELADGLLNLWVVGIRYAELKRVGFLEQKEGLDAHGGFTGVVENGSKLRARGCGIRAFAHRRETRSRLWS